MIDENFTKNENLPNQYRNFVKQLNEYRKASIAAVQSAIVPIIKSYNVKELSELTGISAANLYSYCKAKPTKPTFDNYMILMAAGINSNPKRNILEPLPRHTKLTPEERKERKQKYSREYYLAVTRNKKLQNND